MQIKPRSGPHKGTEHPTGSEGAARTRRPLQVAVPRGSQHHGLWAGASPGASPRAESRAEGRPRDASLAGLTDTALTCTDSHSTPPGQRAVVQRPVVQVTGNGWPSPPPVAPALRTRSAVTSPGPDCMMQQTFLTNGTCPRGSDPQSEWVGVRRGPWTRPAAMALPETAGPAPPPPPPTSDRPRRGGSISVLCLCAACGAARATPAFSWRE